MTTEKLPLPNYDHLTLPALTSRVRSLDAEEVAVVLAYEQEHGDRLPVVEILRRRLDALRSGAQPSGGDPAAERPEVLPGAVGSSQVSPATTGPKINPPSHGDPTNPAQPRSTG